MKEERERQQSIFFLLFTLWNCSFLYPHPCYLRRMKLKERIKEKEIWRRGRSEARRSCRKGE
jgi:hypothetical protein